MHLELSAVLLSSVSGGPEMQLAVAPIVFLLLAGGLLAGVSPKKKLRKVKRPEPKPDMSPKSCDEFTEKDREKSRRDRQKALAKIASANLAPERIVYFNGEDVEDGILQIIWKSDGPWGRPGCETLKYGVRSFRLAETSVTDKNINVDIETILAAENKWGPEHYDDELLLQRPWAEGFASGDPSSRMARDVGYLTYQGSQSDYDPERRSWLEAQVSSGEFVWTTGGFPFGANHRYDKNLNSGPVPVRSGEDFPQIHPSAIYGALYVYWESPSSWLPSGAPLPPGKMQVRGPDALILLRPDENGRGRAISFYGKQYVDYTMILDPADSDVLYEGKNWFREEKVYVALNDPRFQDVFSHTAEAKEGPPRPVDVLLWMVFQEAEKDYSMIPDEDHQPKPGSLDYLNAIGNHDWEVWNDLFESKIGWASLKSRHEDDVAAILGVAISKAGW